MFAIFFTYCHKNLRFHMFVKSMFLKVKHEPMAEWMMEFVIFSKTCHNALTTASRKIDQLKETVISLQETKLQDQ